MNVIVDLNKGQATRTGPLAFATEASDLRLNGFPDYLDLKGKSLTVEMRRVRINRDRDNDVTDAVYVGYVFGNKATLVVFND